MFLINVVTSIRRGEVAAEDPWDARTLEWLTASPPPEHNFDEVPIVTSRDEFWHRKYADDGTERVPLRVPAGASADHVGEGHGGGHDIHMPSPSFYPIVIALGLPIMAYGVFFEGLVQVILLGVGALLTFGGMAGWVMEPSIEESH